MKLIIGNQNYSTWSMRPWVWIHFHEIPVTVEKITLFSEQAKSVLGGHFSDGKVPLLIDDGLEIWDTLSMLEYLNEKFPHARGWPQDSKARAVARSVSAEMHSSFANLRNALPMNCRKKFPNYKLEPEVRRDINRIKAIWHRCRTEYGTDGEWLFGDYCIADAMFAPVALRFEGYDVSLSGTEKDYVQRVLEHADMIKWINAGKDEKEVIEMGEV